MTIGMHDLQNLMKEPSSTARADIAELVSAEFSQGKFSPAEQKIAVEIFRLLVSDTEIKVRKILSEYLSHSMQTPHDVALKLASDVNEVALPMLLNSYVLLEEDLISIIQSTMDVEIMSTIARRDTVSRELAETLIEKSNTTVIETLLGNKSASIPDTALNKIYSTCSENASIMELMVKRGGLPIVLAEQLFFVVSDEMQRVLTRQYKLSLKVAEQSTNHVRELMTLGLIDQDVNSMDINKLVDQLYQRGNLNLSIIIRSLCLGNLRFFEHAVAKLADVPLISAQLLILDPGQEGFVSLYKSCCLPMELFDVTKFLLGVVLEETGFGRYECSDFRSRLSNRLAENASILRAIENMDYLQTILQTYIYE